jgi:hypothetical protein
VPTFFLLDLQKDKLSVYKYSYDEENKKAICKRITFDENFDEEKKKD